MLLLTDIKSGTDVYSNNYGTNLSAMYAKTKL